MPCSLQAARVSSSRFEPPGWMIAVTPAAAAASGPSRNGKKASEASTAPRARSPALLDGDPDRVEPAHLAGADADELAVPGQHDRVRLDHRADPPGEGQVAAARRRSAAGRWRPGRRPGRPRPRPSPGRAGPPSIRRRSKPDGGGVGRADRRLRGRAGGRCSSRSAWSSAARARRARSPGRGSPRGTGPARTSARPSAGRPAGSGRRSRRRR